MKKNPSIRTYTEKHRVETLIIDEKYNIKVVSHFVNDKLKTRNITCKCDFGYEGGKYIHPVYITNKTLFNKERKNNHYADIKWDTCTTNDFPEKVDLNKIVLLDTLCHMMYNYQGKPIPYLHSFDYIGTPFNNETLDLNKAIKILKKHKAVKKVSEILDIDYYNVSGYRDKYIRVDIFPSDEDYQMLYKKLKDKHNLQEALHDGFRPDKQNNYLGLYPEAVIKS